MKYERKPPEDSSIEYFETLDSFINAFEKLPQADLERMKGKHLLSRRLRLHAEGKVDFAAPATEKENLHLALCDDCGDKVIQLERAHIRRLKEQAGETVSVCFKGKEKAQRCGILVCRSFRMDLVFSMGCLSLEIESDDASRINDFRITDLSMGKAVEFTKERVNPSVLKIDLGSVAPLMGQRLGISFKYQEEAWTKNIFIQGAKDRRRADPVVNA